LIYVLAIVAMVGALAGALLDETATLVFEAREAHLAACKRNLQASGLAWARLASRAHQQPTPTTTMPSRAARELDVSALGVPGGTLEVTVKGGRATAAASCRQGNRLWRGTAQGPTD
jgi:type II secretory pathway component PulK